MDKFSEWLEAERGRVTKLAAALKITHGAISQWKRVPIDRVADVSAITGIPREELRPEIFGEATQ